MLAAIVLVAPTLAFAQIGQTAVLTGTVTDASGAAIPDATVSVKSEKTGEVRNVKSDGAGHYSVANLPPTSYAVEAKAPALGLSVAQSRWSSMMVIGSTSVGGAAGRRAASQVTTASRVTPGGSASRS
jgi:hypothetical protein